MPKGEYKWLEPVLTLQDKCIGRYRGKSIEEMVEWCQTKCPVQCRYYKRYPFEEVYVICGIGELTKNQFKNFRTSIIAFTMIPEYDYNGNEKHSYFTAYGYNGAVFVKSFKEGVLETTQNETEAKHFYSDEEADKVLEYLRDVKHPWTIALHDFKGFESICACVHYPNYNWSNNGNLQPALIHKTVQEWCEDHETS